MTSRLPKGVIALGFVSLFMDVSSEMIHALLPLFVTGTLGASALVLGLIEGAGEATASIVKFFSGWFSDHIGKRKPLALLGYGLSALTKPVFALAAGPGLVLGARLADRIGKGIRGAPRDALVADMVAPEQRGAAFGLRQSMDTVGAFAGPLLAMVLIGWAGWGIRQVFSLALLPALISVAILWAFVREPEAAPDSNRPRPRLDRASLAALQTPFWRIVTFGVILSLARFSEAFLILRASEGGLALWQAPLVLILMNLVYAAAAWPAGALSDRIGRRGLLAVGIGSLVLAHLLLAATASLWLLGPAILLWGLHMALTQGLISAEIPGVTPAHLRATGFGLFNLAGGLATFAANLLAGLLWAEAGATATFLAGAVLSLAALVQLGRLTPVR